MTSDTSMIIYESDICNDLMYMLSNLDIGHNRVVRFWMAQELHILLTQGKKALDDHRRQESRWWG